MKMSNRVITLPVLLPFYFVASMSKQELHSRIGAIFDKNEDEDVSSAFHYRLSKSPLKTSTLKQGPVKSVNLTSVTHTVDMEDSYDVGSSICELMQNGIVTVYGSHTMATNDVIKSYTDTFQLPFISSNVAINYSAISSSLSLPSSQLPVQGFQMFVRPLYAKALLDLIRHYAWKDLWYIFDSEEGLERLQQLLDCLSDNNYPVRTHIYRVHDANEAFGTLQRLDSRKEESKRVLLDLPTKDCEKVLQMQNKETKGMLHHYFIVGLGISEIKLDAFNHGGMNVSGFRIVDPNNGTVKNFIFGWSNATKGNLKKLPYEAALAADAATVVQLSLERLIIQPSSNYQSKEELLRSLNKTEPIDCDVDPVKTWKYGHSIMKSMLQVEFGGLTGQVKFDAHGLRRDYKMDVLEVSMSRGLARIGTWFSEQGLVIQPADKIRPIKGNNTIANRTRIVTSILTAPYLMKRSQPADGTQLTGNDRYEGYCADLTKMIADFVGFDYIIKPVNDTKYGQKGENNNSWNGMVGELIRREADLAIAPLTITADREQVIDFSKPFMSLGISIMIKRPLKEQPGVFSFMNPLSYEIWMCVIFAYIGVSVVLFLVSRFSPFEWHIEDHTDGPSVTNNFTIFNSLWFSLGAFMQQGCDIEPRSVSGRIVGSVWWFFTLIIISSYTANLAAFLTVERMQSPIESAEDLAKQTEIKYGMVHAGSTMEFFKRSTIPVYERMWAFMTTTEPSVFVASNEKGVDRVRTEKYAFLIESTTNDYINQVPPCDTMKVGSNLDSKGYGVGTPLGSDLRDRITLAVLELSENEELAKLEKTWWYEKSKCPQDSSILKKQEATSSLELPNVAGIFYILIGGLSLALIMATCEFLYKSKVEARRRKTTFSNAVKSKARLSITGMPERQTTSYTYAPTAQLISLDGWSETNTHTQV